MKACEAGEGTIQKMKVYRSGEIELKFKIISGYANGQTLPIHDIIPHNLEFVQGSRFFREHFTNGQSEIRIGSLYTLLFRPKDRYDDCGLTISFLNQSSGIEFNIPIPTLPEQYLKKDFEFFVIFQQNSAHNFNYPTYPINGNWHAIRPSTLSKTTLTGDKVKRILTVKGNVMGDGAICMRQILQDFRGPKTNSQDPRAIYIQAVPKNDEGCHFRYRIHGTALIVTRNQIKMWPRAGGR